MPSTKTLPQVVKKLMRTVFVLPTSICIFTK